MTHGIYRVVAFEFTGPYALRITFDDGKTRVIDFKPVLTGDLYGPLRDLNFFNRVKLDSEVGTLEWPNGADFDPATLHDWPELADEIAAMAQRWKATERHRGTD